MKKFLSFLISSVVVMHSFSIPVFASEISAETVKNTPKTFSWNTSMVKTSDTEKTGWTGFTQKNSEDNRPVIDLDLTVNNSNCVANGEFINGDSKKEFEAEGYVETINENNVEGFLASLTGTVEGENMTMVCTYDSENEDYYIYASIGCVGEDTVPIQMEFGTFTDSIQNINTVFMEENVADTTSYEISPLATSDDTVKYQSSNSLNDDRNDRLYCLSLYSPDSAEYGKNFLVASKINTNSSNLIDYVAENVDSTQTGSVLAVDSAKVEMYSNKSDYMEIISSTPEDASRTVTLFIPYYIPGTSASSGSFGLQPVPATLSSVDCTLKTSDLGAKYKSIHDFDFGDGYRAASNTDLKGSSIQACREGFGVRNIFSYVNANDVTAKFTVKAEITVGYMGEGTRPSSTIYKTVSLSGISTTSNVSIYT